VSARAREREQDTYRFVPLPLPPLCKLFLLLLDNLRRARTLNAVPLKNEGLPYLSTALGRRQLLSIGLGLLPSIVDGNLEGDGKEGVHILKEVVEVDFIRLFLEDILDLEMMRKIQMCIKSDSPSP